MTLWCHKLSVAYGKCKPVALLTHETWELIDSGLWSCNRITFWIYAATAVLCCHVFVWIGPRLHHTIAVSFTKLVIMILQLHIMRVIFMTVVSWRGNLVSSQHGFPWTNIPHVNTVQSLRYDFCEITCVYFWLLLDTIVYRMDCTSYVLIRYCCECYGRTLFTVCVCTGNDVARSMLVFAKGKPLGPHGLDWLKIHLVNLTGFKKRSWHHDNFMSRYYEMLLQLIVWVHIYLCKDSVIE